MAFTTCDEKFNITYPLDIYNNLKAFRLPPDHQKGLKSYLNLPPYSDSLEGTRADAIWLGTRGEVKKESGGGKMSKNLQDFLL